MEQKYPIQTFRGTKFYRKPTGYYKADHVIGGQYMHRAVWEHYRGKIPPKHHVHHKNGDRADNRLRNLELIGASEHAAYHGKARAIADPKASLARMELAREAAKKWHRSPVGRKWHSEHARRSAKNIPLEKYKCALCKTEYLVKQGGRKRGFCGMNCQSEARRRSGIDDVKRECQTCKKSFTANKYSKKRFCTVQCAAASRKV